MRIAVFTDTWEPQINGVVTSIRLFVNELRRRGHEIYIVCPADKRLKKTKYVFPLHSFKFRPYPEYRIGVPSLQVYRFVKKLSPDIIHIHSPALIGSIGMFIGRRLKIPVVATYHTRLDEYLSYLPGNRFSAFRRLNKTALNRWLKTVLNRASVLIVPSRDTEHVLKNSGIDAKTVVLPTGIKTKRFRGRRAEWEPPMVLHVGRLCRERNIDVVLRAFSMLKKDARLIITSSGPAEKELRRLATALGISNKVKFTGYISEREKEKLYRRATVFVTASTTETQGLVILEAMASSTPVVAANSGGVRDCIKNGSNGILVRPSSPKALSNAIERVLSDRPLRRRLALGGMKTAKELSVERCTDRLEKIYGSIFKPKVSVVVPTRNEERFLKDCLVSLRRQTLRPEIIVVDGHSRDKTRAIAKRFADKVILDRGGGISDARNLGWKAASGEIIAYCDADAKPGAKWVESVVKNIGKADCVSGPLSTYDKKSKQKVGFKILADFFPRFAALVGFHNIWGANMAFKKSVLEKIPFEGNFLEDFDMALRARNAFKVKFAKDMELQVSSRRFEKSFFRTCAMFYVPAAARLLLLGDHKQKGYF